MSLTLYTYPGNPRAWKAQIAAEYAGVKVNVPAFEMGKDNKTKEFADKNPVQKVPTADTPDGPLFESNAIARYVARKGGKLFGSNEYEAGLVDQWIDFATSEIDLPSAAWLLPIFDIVPENREATSKAKGDIRKVFGILNNHLATRTFLVGERVSLADIVVSMSVYRLYKTVLDPGFRKGWVNVNRWYLTLVNQPEFIRVIGETQLCEKMAVAKPSAPKAAPEKKEEKPKAAAKPKPAPKKKEEDEGEDDEFKEKASKEKNPLDALPKSKLDMDEWKRTYSNEKTREVALPWFWDHYDPEGYSLWIADYKYNDECTKNFMTLNLLGGFIQRLDKVRKYGFGSLLIFGEEPKLQVASAWLFRGTEVPKEMKEVDDYPHYEWRKVDHTNEADKKLVEDFWAWNGEFGGKYPAFNDKGKVFK
jgi:elongation factor 1-gamma